MKKLKYLLILSAVILLDSNLFGIDINESILFPQKNSNYFSKENVQVSLYSNKKQNYIRLFGTKSYSPPFFLKKPSSHPFLSDIEIPIEKLLIEKDSFGHCLVDFLNLNPKEIKVKLYQYEEKCSVETKEFYIQPNREVFETSEFFIIRFDFTHDNKEYVVWLKSNKSKPTISELESSIFVSPI